MHIMNSMEQRNNLQKGRQTMTITTTSEKEGLFFMEEKIYKTMSGSGALSITLGVIAIVVGVVSGVLLIVSGARLLSRKSRIMF